MRSPSKKISLCVNDQIAWLAFDNKAKRNAIDFGMWKAIPECLDTLDKIPDVRVICVASKDLTIFSAGADISEFEMMRFSPEDASNYETANVEAFDSVRNVSRPTIACIQGPCIGAAAGIAAACDLRVASDKASFAVPAGKLGLAYPYQSIDDFVRLLGAARTKDLIFTGRTIDAAEAFELNFLDRLFPSNEFERNTKAFLANIATQAPMSLEAAKIAVAASSGDQSKTIAAIHAADLTLESHDYREGVVAFKEKRRPQFQGR